MKWCGAKKLEARRYDCIVNKTSLSAKMDLMIGGNAPSVYLATVQKKAGIDSARMDEATRTHVIDQRSCGQRTSRRSSRRGRSRSSSAMGKASSRMWLLLLRRNWIQRSSSNSAPASSSSSSSSSSTGCSAPLFGHAPISTSRTAVSSSRGKAAPLKLRRIRRGCYPGQPGQPGWS